MHTSSPYGAIGIRVWHDRDSTASSLIAPESHVFNNVPLTFAGWTVDGARWPDATAPSRHQIAGIPMPAPRIATATYLPTAQDSDANSLPDWFEQRYYGQLGQDRYADSDEDGFEDELEAGDHTDPFDDASVPSPPAIQHDPLDSPAPTPAPWTVLATITDNYQVASATLHWRRNGGLARSAVMTNEPGSTERFLAQIPSPARDGDEITYHLSAVDAAGFSAESATWTVTVAYARMAFDPTEVAVSLLGQRANPNRGAVRKHRQPTLGNFARARARRVRRRCRRRHQRLDAAGWQWRLAHQRQESSSPSNAWYCGQEASRQYLNSTHAALVSPPIRLAAGAPRLDFMHRARFEIDQDNFPDGIHYWDSGILEITDNAGLTWQALVPEGGYPGLITSNWASPFAPETPCFVDTEDWEPVGADLSAYANEEVQFRFRFGADQYTVAEGWRIDDIVVSPRTASQDWLALSTTNFSVAAGLTNDVTLTLDTAFLEPMASGHLALYVQHNDPEQVSPLIIPIALHNTTRRVRVTSAGPGQADPAGESLVPPDQFFSVAFTADPGAFIADLQTNASPVPLPDSHHHPDLRMGFPTRQCRPPCGVCAATRGGFGLARMAGAIWPDQPQLDGRGQLGPGRRWPAHVAGRRTRVRPHQSRRCPPGGGTRSAG
jgi:hypothetical protein